MSADCRRCRHHYITWDPAHPHGCRAMGFKGRRLPVAVVRQATPGLDCQRFEPRLPVVRQATPGLDCQRFEPRLPVVRQATPGLDCQRFEPRPATPRRPRRK